MRKLCTFSERKNGITLSVICIVGLVQLAYFGVFHQYQQYILQQELHYQEVGLQNQTWHHINNEIEFHHSDSISPIRTNATNIPQTRSTFGKCKFPPESLRLREEPDRKHYEMSVLERRFRLSQAGGRFKPQHCLAIARIAIIVPYRDRDEHFRLFLSNVIPKLKRQQLDFTIYLIEQAPGILFNRGMIRNIGFLEASKVADYDCYIFNDVDTIPEDDRNFYVCDTEYVRHLVTKLKRNQYKLPYVELAGGIIAFTKDQFQAVNGYSNQFYVWGGEDDDIFRRVQNTNFKFRRPPSLIGTVTTFQHNPDPIVKSRLDVLDRVKDREKEDGLNSVQYEKVFHENRKLYTWIYVQIKKPKDQGTS